MKPIISFFLMLTVSLSSFAGDSGVSLISCMSNSQRTTLVYRSDNFADDINAQVFLAIDGYMLVQENSQICINDPDSECNYVNFDYNAKTLLAGAEEYVALKVEFLNDKFTKAVLKKGFTDPRNYSPFSSDIYLNCTYSFENP